MFRLLWKCRISKLQLDDTDGDCIEVLRFVYLKNLTNTSVESVLKRLYVTEKYNLTKIEIEIEI